jgi:hypothetical protein
MKETMSGDDLATTKNPSLVPGEGISGANSTTNLQHHHEDITSSDPQMGPPTSPDILSSKIAEIMKNLTQPEEIEFYRGYLREYLSSDGDENRLELRHRYKLFQEWLIGRMGEVAGSYNKERIDALEAEMQNMSTLKDRNKAHVSGEDVADEIAFGICACVIDFASSLESTDKTRMTKPVRTNPTIKDLLSGKGFAKPDNHEKMGSGDRTNAAFRWIHLPYNNMSWVEASDLKYLSFDRCS